MRKQCTKVEGQAVQQSDWKLAAEEQTQVLGLSQRLQVRLDFATGCTTAVVQSAVKWKHRVTWSVKQEAAADGPRDALCQSKSYQL